MKRVSLILSAVVVTAMMLSSCGGVEYKEVIIGKQVWMTENLNVDEFRNGDPIPHAKTAEEWKKAGENGQPAWCYYDNDPSNGEKYGKLYNWYAVNDSRGLAPKGWHIPSDAEWTTLTDNLGGKYAAATQMKATKGSDYYGYWKDDGDGTNESGFSGLPGGFRNSLFSYSETSVLKPSTFSLLGISGYWWSSTESETDSAWNRDLYYLYNIVYRDNYGKEKGFSVRCIKD